MFLKRERPEMYDFGKIMIKEKIKQGNWYKNKNKGSSKYVCILFYLEHLKKCFFRRKKLHFLACN